MKAIKSNFKNGFTLIEILVVISIIAILTAITVPLVSGYISDTSDQALYGEASVVYQAANTYETAYKDTSTNFYTNAQLSPYLEQTYTILDPTSTPANHGEFTAQIIRPPGTTLSGISIDTSKFDEYDADAPVYVITGFNTDSNSVERYFFQGTQNFYVE